MARNKLEEAEYRRIADDAGLSPVDVANIVRSFFDIIASEARAIGMNTPKKIYSKSVFDAKTMNHVRCIPYIGRVGPNYSRYLAWRRNESKNYLMEGRVIGGSLSREEIENIAKNVLSGNGMPEREKKRDFDRIWLVGEEGKKQARQVIKKEVKDEF